MKAGATQMARRPAMPHIARPFLPPLVAVAFAACFAAAISADPAPAQLAVVAAPKARLRDIPDERIPAHNLAARGAAIGTVFVQDTPEPEKFGCGPTTEVYWGSRNA
jgi:hypothetical protein